MQAGTHFSHPKVQPVKRNLFSLPLFFLREAFLRFANYGVKSAGVYIKCAIVNGVIRIGNRLFKGRVVCPCCGWAGYDFRMLDCHRFTVPSVVCPSCRSQERHRMLHLYFRRREPEFFASEGYVLHFSPVKHVDDLVAQNPKLRPVGVDYNQSMVIDFEGDKALIDMQALAFAEGSFTFLFCIHVLEHVPDDRLGIRELHRILKLGGIAYIMVPFMMGWPDTVEFGGPDPRLFDHMRGYSPVDFKQRLAPLTYEKIMPDSFLTDDELRRYRIPRDSQILYRCVKK